MCLRKYPPMEKRNHGFVGKKSFLSYFFISCWLLFLFIAVSFVSTEISRVFVDRRKRAAEQMVGVIFLSQEKLVEDSKLIFENWASEIKNSTEIEQDPCQASIIQLVEKNSEHLYYGAANAEGDLLCSWVPVPEGAHVRERKYFKDVLANKKLSIGEHQLGLITGSPSINLAYPVMDEAGEIQFVLILAINLDWFDQKIKDLRLPVGTKLSIVDYKGVVLATYPKIEAEGNGELVDVNPRLLSIIFSKKIGSIEGEEVGEAEEIYAFRTFGGTEEKQASFYSVVTLSEEIIFKKLKKLVILIHLIRGTFLISWLILSSYFLKKIDLPKLRRQPKVKLK